MKKLFKKVIGKEVLKSGQTGRQLENEGQAVPHLFPQLKCGRL